MSAYERVGQEEKGKVTPTLILSVLAATIGSWQFGWHSGDINAPQDIIESDLNIAHNGPQWSAAVAAFTVGGLVGAQLSSGHPTQD